jgi:hypothetical protein
LDGNDAGDGFPAFGQEDLFAFGNALEDFGEAGFGFSDVVGGGGHKVIMTSLVGQVKLFLEASWPILYR